MFTLWTWHFGTPLSFETAPRRPARGGRQAAADNPQWALQPLPSDVADALKGLDKW